MSRPTPPSSTSQPHAPEEPPTVTPQKYDIARLRSDGSNFHNWKRRMRIIYINRKLWGIVQGKETRPTDPNLAAKWDDRENEALAQILLTVEDEPMNGIAEAATSAEAWTSLHERYEGKGSQSIVLQVTSLFQDKLQEELPLEPQLNSMVQRTKVLAAQGVQFDESITASAMIATLPESYNTLRAILTSMLDKPEVERVRNAILSEERARKATSGSAAALKAQLKGKDQGQKSNGGKDETGENKPRCKFCGRKGHAVEDCRQKKIMMEELQKELKETHQTDDHTAKIAHVDSTHRRSDSFDSPIQLYLAHSRDAIHSTHQPPSSTPLRDKWIIDSGANPSMCRHQSWFKTYRPFTAPRHVQLGDNRSTLALGYGSITIKAAGPEHTSREVMLPDVYFVPSLNGNMLSVSQITKMDYEVRFNVDECTIYSPQKELVATGQHRDGLFTLELRESHINSAFLPYHNSARRPLEDGLRNIKSILAHRPASVRNTVASSSHVKEGHNPTGSDNMPPTHRKSMPPQCHSMYMENAPVQDNSERFQHPPHQVLTNVATPELRPQFLRQPIVDQVGGPQINRSSMNNSPKTHRRPSNSGHTLEWAHAPDTSLKPLVSTSQQENSTQSVAAEVDKTLRATRTSASGRVGVRDFRPRSRAVLHKQPRAAA